MEQHSDKSCLSSQPQCLHSAQFVDFAKKLDDILCEEQGDLAGKWSGYWGQGEENDF